MTLHSDMANILYGCRCVYQTPKEKQWNLLRYFEKMDHISQLIQNGSFSL